MPADPKPSAPHKATQAEWRKLVEAKHGPCRSCKRPDDIELHHLVGGSHRADVAENLAPLCRMCHRKYTDHAAGWKPIAHRLFESLSMEELAYCLRVKGVDWCYRRFGLEVPDA